MGRVMDFLRGKETKPKQLTSTIPDRPWTYTGRQTLDIGSLNYTDLRKIWQKDPLVQKAVHKKNRDALRDGWTLKHKKKDQTIKDNVQDIINEFNETSEFHKNLEIAGNCANIYGNGLIEILYYEQEKNGSELPISEAAMPGGFNLLNMETFRGREQHKGINYYKYGADVLIHPDRIIDVIKNQLPYSNLGISDIYTLYIILKSKINSDESLGKILTWFGNGKIDVTLKSPNVNDNYKNAVAKNLEKNQDFFIHGENEEYIAINPVTINPSPFLEHFYMNIAAQFLMPKYVLTGVQPGQLTGSEVGLEDYYKEIEAERQFVWKPIITRVYKQLLKSHNIEWEYEVIFPPVLIDESNEANIFKTRTEAASMLLDRFTITEEEVRKIITDGITGKDGSPNIEIVRKEEPVQPIKPLVKEEPVPTQKEIEEQEQFIMENRDKLLGEIELIQQEVRCKQAEEKHADI